MPREFAIDGVVLNDNSDCFVIAELGHNHQGELEKCKEMIRVAKECGADAVKLQKRDNRSLFTRELYDSPYLNRNSYGATYGQHREFLEFGRAEYEEIKHLTLITLKDQYSTYRRSPDSAYRGSTRPECHRPTGSRGSHPG